MCNRFDDDYDFVFDYMHHNLVLALLFGLAHSTLLLLMFSAKKDTLFTTHKEFLVKLPRKRRV